jgi:hypothetical protein
VVAVTPGCACTALRVFNRPLRLCCLAHAAAQFSNPCVAWLPCLVPHNTGGACVLLPRRRAPRPGSMGCAKE